MEEIGLGAWFQASNLILLPQDAGWNRGERSQGLFL